MSVLIQLPDDIVLDFLHEWIDIKELGLLDKSLSSKQHRPSLLTLFALLRPLNVRDSSDGRKLCRYQCIWTRDKTFRYFASGIFCQWTLNRGLRLRLLILGPKNTTSSGTLMYRLDLTSIVELVLLSQSSVVVTKLCPSLKIIEVRNEIAFCQLSRHVLNNLKGLYLNIPVYRNPKVLENLWMCTNLTALRIDIVMHHPALVDTINLCPLLIDVQLESESVDILLVIYRCCRNIEFITVNAVSLSQQFMVSCMTDLLNDRPTLKTIQVSTKDRNGINSVRIIRSGGDRELEIVGYQYHVEIVLILHMLEKLTKMTFKNCRFVKETIDVLLNHSTPTLTSFVCDSLIALEPLQCILQCPLMTSMNLQGVLWGDAYEDLFSVPHKLSELELILDGLATLETVHAIFKSCPLIKRFLFAGVAYVDDAYSSHFFEQLVDQVHARFTVYSSLTGTLQFDNGMTIFFGRGEFYY